jgi:hypothetical protein
MNPATPSNTHTEAPADYRDRYEQLTGLSLHHCPVCGRGRMLTIEQIAPAATRALPASPDTS